jgi:hypothetical protein
VVVSGWGLGGWGLGAGGLGGLGGWGMGVWGLVCFGVGVGKGSSQIYMVIHRIEKESLTEVEGTVWLTFMY